MKACDISPESRRLVDLEDGLTARWREDLALVDQADDDLAFTQVVTPESL